MKEEKEPKYKLVRVYYTGQKSVVLQRNLSFVRAQMELMNALKCLNSKVVIRKQ